MLTPFLMMRSSSPEMVQMGSDLQIYSQKYFSEKQSVKGPISVATID